MKSYKLSFATINVIERNLAEVIIDEGVNIDLMMVDEYHDFLTMSLKAPFGLFYNKRNSYSYTFEAQKTMSILKSVKAVAVLNYTHASVMSTEMILKINAVNDHRIIKLFVKKDEALSWIKNILID